MSKKTPKGDAATADALDFEQALADLEALVARMEKGDLPLEEALASFERGIALTRRCQSALKDAELKVQVLVERDGKQALEPFDDER
jgi:exodeoxyribonuclease VII small subunit